MGNLYEVMSTVWNCILRYPIKNIKRGVCKVSSVDKPSVTDLKIAT